MARTIILALVIAFLSPSVLSAQTVIPGGNVSGLWAAVGSPYLIEGDITVPTADLLVIEPGVEVYFQGQYEWTVNGWLEAMGTPTDSILITASDSSFGWLGILVENAPDSSYLEYCIIQYATEVGPGNDGCGVQCIESNPVISHCTLKYNSGLYGGAIYCHESGARIDYNDIVYNGREGQTECGGGILVAWEPSPVIAFNNIRNNYASDIGGGICCDKGARPLIVGNYITRNNDQFCVYGGGGIGTIAEYADVTIIENIVVNNSTTANGGGIYGDFTNVDKTVIYNNSATNGGGIACNVCINVVNSIVWNNFPDQMWGLYWGEVTYNNIQDGWPGIGNIDEDPMFVCPEFYDFRLQWGSPCIDAGDPNSPLDPDGTRADMGAFYYDQSVPVRVLLTPHERSIVIPAEGGSFDYTIWLTNIDPSAPQIEAWIDVTSPDGMVVGPLLGPVSTSLDSGITISRERTQNVPAGAPEGIYTYNAYAVAGPDTSFDTFPFFKLEPNGPGGSVNWGNTGESLDEMGEAGLAPTLTPETFSLSQNYPNPFNSMTTFRFTLQTQSEVTLTIYNISGRKVAALVDGYRQAGSHEVTWDAAGLPSGLYIYKLKAEMIEHSGKMILLK